MPDHSKDVIICGYYSYPAKH